MEKVWIRNGKEMWITDPPSQNKLDNKIYVVKNHEIRGFYLEEKQDSFQFPYKVYGIENNFIDRVIKAYDSSKNNLGILLYGVKGTGKSVTAKMICNKLNLPVILIEDKFNTDSRSVDEYVNSIPQELIIYIDEYEKKYEDSDSLLSIMDGSNTSIHKRLFLLTSNNLDMSYNLFSRPSRIRYMKKYSSLGLNEINKVIDDSLIHKDKKESIIEFCNQLTIITIDILKSIINEVNLFNESPQDFSEIFNVNKAITAYDIYEINYSNNSKKLIFSDVSSNIEEISLSFVSHGHYNYERDLQINGKNYGSIIAMIDYETFKISVHKPSDEDDDDFIDSIRKRTRKKISKDEIKILKFTKK